MIAESKPTPTWNYESHLNSSALTPVTDDRPSERYRTKNTGEQPLAGPTREENLQPEAANAANYPPHESTGFSRFSTDHRKVSRPSGLFLLRPPTTTTHRYCERVTKTAVKNYYAHHTAVVVVVGLRRVARRSVSSKQATTHASMHLQSPTSQLDGLSPLGPIESNVF